MATAKIHLGFVFTVGDTFTSRTHLHPPRLSRSHSALLLQLQPNSYYTFYDDHMQNWSVIFESEKSSSDFCREVRHPPPPLTGRAVPDPTDAAWSAFLRYVWPRPTAPPP